MFHRMRISLLPATSVLGVLCLAPHASSQLKYTLFASEQEALGESVAIAGDVNGDGYQDVLIGSPRYQSSAGRVLVVSGKTGTTLATHLGDETSEQVGITVSAAGDVDADGFADYLISEFNGSFSVYSGRTGVILFQRPASTSNFRVAMDGLGDLNGDGHDDFLITSDGDPDGSGYRVYSGRDFTVIHSGVGPSSEEFGRACTGLGDVDGDQVNDFAVSSPCASPGIDKAGRISVFSGATGSLLRDIEGAAEKSAFGFAIDSAGDVDGDGLDDLLVGGAPANNGSGQAWVYRSSDWSPVWSVVGDQEQAGFGFSVASAGDVNQDGRLEFLIASPFHSAGSLNQAGRCHLYSYGETQPWKVWDGTERSTLLGKSVAGGADVNGDGFLDVVIGSPGFDVFGSPERYGLAEVHFLCPAIANVDGQGWPGARGIPEISLDHAPLYESTCKLSVANSSNFPTTGYLVAGTAAASISTRFGGLLQLVPETMIPVSLPIQGADIEFQAPPDLHECEPAWYVQALVVDPESTHGLAFSRRLKMKFGRD